MGQPMGLGILGQKDTVFKRKFRWTMEFKGVCGIDKNDIDATFVKATKRPTLSIEETPINYLNGIMYIPGKGTPDELTVNYYDVASQAGSKAISSLFGWLATVYDFTDSIYLTQSSAQNVRGGYTANVGLLKMLDGCGETIDGFAYLNPWPKQINFGELDYSMNEECTVDCTFRYRNFEYFTSNGRCSNTFDVYCAGCGDGGDIAYPGAKNLESYTSSDKSGNTTPQGTAGPLGGGPGNFFG